MRKACEYYEEYSTFFIWLQQQLDGLPHSQEAFNYMAHDSLIPSICLLFSFPGSIDLYKFKQEKSKQHFTKKLKKKRNKSA